mgnify:CR=1 FL=1|jgi:type IV pilus assembly protein PilN
MNPARDIRVNLLPHRAAGKARRKRRFATALVASVTLALLVVGAGQWLLDRLNDRQAERNALLEHEASRLDGRIAEIQALRQKTDALLRRQRVIEALQANRSGLVRLFDEMARRMPHGVHLTGLQQQGDTLTLQGMAQSGARVSDLMRKLGESPHFDAPRLIEVRGVVQGNRRLSQFSLTINQLRPAAGMAPGAP